MSLTHLMGGIKLIIHYNNGRIAFGLKFCAISNQIRFNIIYNYPYNIYTFFRIAVLKIEIISMKTQLNNLWDMRHAICYVSTANSNLNLHQIEALLNLSKDGNERKNIKGVLLYSEGNFFQILEGEKTLVLDVFKKIEQDPRHYGLIKILGKDITQGACDGYKVDILNEEYKHGYKVPQKYLDALQGISPEVKKSMEKMLRLFIITR